MSYINGELEWSDVVNDLLGQTITDCSIADGTFNLELNPKLIADGQAMTFVKK